jgi:hypothetical protein
MIIIGRQLKKQFADTYAHCLELGPHCFQFGKVVGCQLQHERGLSILRKGILTIPKAACAARRTILDNANVKFDLSR